MQKIRLMQITHDLAIGGLQQVVVNICRTVDRDKFDISVLCLRSRGEYATEVENLGIKVHLLPKGKYKTDYLSFIKVAKLLRRERIDVIHTHNTQPLIDGTIAALLAGVKAVVHTDHARSFPDKWRYMFAERVMSYFAYRFVGVSEHTSHNLAKYEKISQKKIVTVLNGIDEKKYIVNIDKRKKRKELGIYQPGPIIGLCARLVEQKGITYLLQAMPSIVREHPDVTLVIAGKGLLAEVLESEARALNVEAHVRFIGPRLDVPELLSLFDVYVLPSLWEGLPMVLIEAMAAGCPCVATNVGGNGIAIHHGQNGLLVEPADPSGIADAVNKMLHNKSMRDQFAVVGRQIFNEKFSASVMTRNYEKLYLNALDR